MAPNETPNSAPQNDFRFDDPRQLAIYDYLKRLVGDGAASFYKDACRIMATNPSFDTTTHLIGHMLREVDVSMLGVLEGITETVPKGTDDRHKKQIKVILDALEIPEDDPIAKAWLDQTTAGLHSMAHRSGLGAPRPITNDFLEAWEKTNLILYGILEKFETRYLNVFDVLNQLAEKNPPTAADVKKIKDNIPNNRVAHEHFFTKISDPAWLPFLESEGFFKNPPAIEKDAESGGYRHPTWPVLIYLGKVAASSPDLVAKILKDLPINDNGNVKSGALSVVINLPKEKKLELLPTVIGWISSGDQFFSSMKSIELVKSLGGENEIEAALAVSQELLGFVPEEAPVVPEGEYIPARDPRTFIDQWHYARFLQDDFLPLSEKDPEKSLTLLTSLLEKHCSLAHPQREEGVLEDYSYISRPAIETTEHLHRDDVEDSLIESILVIATRAIDSDTSNISGVLAELEKYQWPVFKRMILYILSKYPNANKEATAKYLSDISLIDNSNYRHEYALLAEVGFDALNDAQIKTIYDFIDQAEPAKELVKQLGYDKDKSERRIKMWQRDSLAFFAPHLNGAHQDKYEALEKDLGQADDPKTPPDRGRVFVGPTSDVRSEQISKMSPEEIVELLKGWEPKKEPHGFGPSREGLGRELGAAVRKDPARFSEMAKSMIGLDPTYVRNYLQPFSEIVQNRIEFEWPAIIDLCLWITEQKREISGREGGDPFDDDPDWGWARRAAISLISHGMNMNVIPPELYDKVWKIVQILTDDPNPTPEQELTREGTISEDAYGLTINSVRGEAMTAVIEFGLWVTRIFEKLPEDKRPKGKIFSIFPEMQKILEQHLTSDPSIAVRAAYGRYLPWLLLLDKDWTLAHLKEIFPEGQFDTPLYDAAWGTYVGHVSVYDDVFESLKNQYEEAIKNIGVNPDKKSRIDRDSRLAEHIMALFWRGKFDVADQDGLLALFWKHADEDTRLHAIDFLGRTLQSLKEPLTDEQAKRLKELWESRIAVAEAAGNKQPYEKEIGAFGWWFASTKLDEGWSISQFLKVLDLAKKVNADYFVVDRLVVLADTRPLETVQILSKLVQRDRQQWVLFGNEADLRSIFTKALHSGDIDAENAAKELINRLAAWGYSAYGDLLLPPPPPEPES